MNKKQKSSATGKELSAKPATRKTAPVRVKVNKHGQALGRKGSETRQRLMEATRQMLQTHSPMELTAVSIAKEAETSSATFYIYFDDVRDVILSISEAASADLVEVHHILEEDWDPGIVDIAHSQRVVDTFNDVWKRHRDVLRFRNLEADRGDRAFADLRVRSAIRIIDRFVERIMGAYPKEQRPSRGEAYAEATVLFAAMEGLAETDPATVEEWQIGAARLSRATAMMLARSFGARLPLKDTSAAAASAVSAEVPVAAEEARQVPLKKAVRRR